MVFCRLLIFFKVNFFEKFFQELYQLSVKQIGPRSDPTFCRACSGSNLFAKTGKFFHAFCHLLIFFQNQLFRKFISGIPSGCQTDWIQIRPNILSGLIWVQSACKGWEIFSCFLSSADFFSKSTFSRIYFWNNI